MSEEEYNGLKSSIVRNGQLQPVVLYEGKILDGLHRHRACLDLHVPVRTTTLPQGVDPVQYVLGANVHRRHLTVGQRAAIAAELTQRLAPGAAERRRATQLAGRAIDGQLQRGASVVANLPPPTAAGKSRAMAARLMRVGERSVQEAVHVLRHDPDLHRQVKAGEVTLHAARQRQATSPAAQQGPAAAADPQPPGPDQVANGGDGAWRRADRSASAAAADPPSLHGEGGVRPKASAPGQVAMTPVFSLLAASQQLIERFDRAPGQAGRLKQAHRLMLEYAELADIKSQLAEAGVGAGDAQPEVRLGASYPPRLTMTPVYSLLAATEGMIEGVDRARGQAGRLARVRQLMLEVAALVRIKK